MENHKNADYQEQLEIDYLFQTLTRAVFIK
jgi:hypothetical protein